VLCDSISAKLGKSLKHGSEWQEGLPSFLLHPTFACVNANRSSVPARELPPQSFGSHLESIICNRNVLCSAAASSRPTLRQRGYTLHRLRRRPLSHAYQSIRLLQPLPHEYPDLDVHGKITHRLAGENLELPLPMISTGGIAINCLFSCVLSRFDLVNG
jgi:hypothetical protein